MIATFMLGVAFVYFWLNALVGGVSCFFGELAPKSRLQHRMAFLFGVGLIGSIGLGVLAIYLVANGYLADFDDLGQYEAVWCLLGAAAIYIPLFMWACADSEEDELQHSKPAS